MGEEVFTVISWNLFFELWNNPFCRVSRSKFCGLQTGQEKNFPTETAQVSMLVPNREIYG